MLNHWLFLKSWLSGKKGKSFIFRLWSTLCKTSYALRLEFSHLNEHKFRHGFKDKLNPLSNCGAEVKTTEHFLLHCQLYSNNRSELFDKIIKVDQQFLNIIAKDQVLVLLYGLGGNNSENLN